jgi:hypothetical protein
MKDNKFKVMAGAKSQPNKDIIDYNNIEPEKVERKDGIPTLEDIKGLIKEVFKDKKEVKQQPMQMPSITIHIGNTFDKMGDTIDKLKQVKKPDQKK